MGEDEGEDGGPEKCSPDGGERSCGQWLTCAHTHLLGSPRPSERNESVASYGSGPPEKYSFIL